MKADAKINQKTEPAAEKKITGAEMIVEALYENGVEQVFGYPGGSVLPLYEAFEKSTIKHTLVSHEQGAVHAADGYARSTGKTGVVFVTSGPGATNTVTGIHTAYSDCAPLVVITGQVLTSLLGTDAFQESDIVNIVKPCTKRSYLVKNVADLPGVLHEAFALAKSGKPGPVLVDIPKDVQLATGIYKAAEKKAPANAKSAPGFNEKIAQAVAMIRAAEKPVLYTGGGVIRSGEQASRALRELAAQTKIPVTSTLMGLGAFSPTDPLWLGMLGLHGTFESNMAMHTADLIIAVGARFDDRITGNLNGFSPKAKIIHIDIDPRAIGKTIKTSLGINADCGEALIALGNALRAGGETKDLGAWWAEIMEWRAKNSLAFANSETITKPQFVMQTLNKLIKGKNAYIVTDVGQNQMWAAQYLDIESPNHLVSSGGLGTMGFGLPAAMGVQLAHPDSLVISISGDGGFQMTCPEMATIAAESLPIKALILNNNGLGMVRQWNHLTYDMRYSPSTSKTQPSFIKLAEAFNWGGFSCETPSDVENKLRALLDAKGPALLDCRIDADENCFPMFRIGGAGHSDMVFGEKE